MKKLLGFIACVLLVSQAQASPYDRPSMWCKKQIPATEYLLSLVKQDGAVESQIQALPIDNATPKEREMLKGFISAAFEMKRLGQAEKIDLLVSNFRSANECMSLYDKYGTSF